MLAFLAGKFEFPANFLAGVLDLLFLGEGLDTSKESSSSSSSDEEISAVCLLLVAADFRLIGLELDFRLTGIEVLPTFLAFLGEAKSILPSKG